MVKEIKEFIPAQIIDDHVIITGNGDCTIGFELMLPEIFTLDQVDYNRLHLELLGFMKKLPIGTIVHKQDFFYQSVYKVKNQTESFTRRANNEVFNERPVMNHYSRMYVTFKNMSMRKATGSTNAAVRLYKWAVTKPVKELEPIIEKALGFMGSLESELDGINKLHAKAMKGDALAKAYKEYFELSFDAPGQGNLSGSWSPYEVQDGFVKVGNKFLGIVSLERQGEKVYEAKRANQLDPSVFGDGIQLEGQMDIELGMMFPVGLGLPINHVVNTSIEIKSREGVFRDLGLERWNESILAFISGAAKEKMAAIDEFKEAVSYKDFTVCKTSVNVLVVSEHLKELNKNLNIVKTAFDNMNGSVGWIENFEVLPLFVGSSPGYSRGNYRTFTNVLQQAICYWCLETHYYADLKGHVYVDRFGKPVVIDLWNNKSTVNRNKFVIGPSGSGKSFWLNDYLDQAYEKGNHIVVMDVGHSYKELCLMCGGMYIDSSQRESLSFNIFLIDQDINGNYDLDDDKRLFIYSVLMTIWKGSKQEIPMESMSIVKEMIDFFYQWVNKNKYFPVFKLFYQFIDVYEKAIKEKRGKEGKFIDFDSMRIVFKAYVEGEYKFLLNNESNVDISKNRFVVFDIESIESDVFAFPVVGLVIIELVMDKIRKLKGEMKTFAIDEGWKMLKSDLKDFTEYLYRTIRKHDGEVILATQNVRDIESTGIADALTVNSDTTVLLDHSSKVSLHPDLQRILSITDGDLIKLNDIKTKKEYRDFFVKTGNISKLLRMQVSDKSAAVYTSVGEDKKKIREHFDKHGNLGLAIEQYIEDKQKKLTA